MRGVNTLITTWAFGALGYELGNGGLYVGDVDLKIFVSCKVIELIAAAGGTLSEERFDRVIDLIWSLPLAERALAYFSSRFFGVCLLLFFWP